MRLIRVTYRATFQQPITGPLNPIGARLNIPVAVEVYPLPNGWMARTPSHAEAKNPPWPLIRMASSTQMCATVASYFEKQLTPWEMWGRPVYTLPLRLLQPEEVEIRENDQVYFKDPPEKEEPPK